MKTTVQEMVNVQRSLGWEFIGRVLGGIRLQNVVHEDNNIFVEEMAHKVFFKKHDQDAFCKLVWILASIREMEESGDSTEDKKAEIVSTAGVARQDLDELIELYANRQCATPRRCNDPLVDPPSRQFPWETEEDLVADLQADAGDITPPPPHWA